MKKFYDSKDDLFVQAFSEAYSVLENELTCITSTSDSCGKQQLHNLLPKIIPSIISS
jgi:hypothetical protein